MDLKNKQFVFIVFSLLVLVPFLKAAPGNPTFVIKDLGENFPIRYEKYGVFLKKGTNDYKFQITNKAGLARAMGAGLFPNTTSLPADPSYIEWKKKNRGGHNPWDFTQSGNSQNDFYVWTEAAGDIQPATKLLFTGQALADAGYIHQALKAYYSILVLFPREACPAADYSFVWYVGSEALSRIESLLSRHPEIGYRLEGAVLKITNGKDTDTKNDQFVIDPGRWVRSESKGSVSLKNLKVIQQRGLGKVRLVQYENKHWQLLVDNKPFVVRGVTYNPVPIGQHISSYGNRWMSEDADENGRPDMPYDSWVDKNKNEIQDANERAVGDFELLRDMGVNAIRIYRSGDENSETIDGEASARGLLKIEYDPREFNKDVLRDLYHRYGISCILGDFLGAYTVSSGATWDEGTDYTDPVQLENMRSVLSEYVKDHRSEPYVLMWVLGNENLMPADYAGVNATRTRASTQVQAYLKFVNEMAALIHRLDPDHPVAVGNLDLLNIEDHAKYAPAVDVFGANSYRGTSGFGNSWRLARESFDRPILITEYGCDAFDSRSGKENQKAQAVYHSGNWEDIQFHLAGGTAEGNAIGGIAFEFLDEWWKSLKGGWETHDQEKDSPLATPDGWSSEEWLGLVSRGASGQDSLLRQPREAYYLYRDKLWKNKNGQKN